MTESGWISSDDPIPMLSHLLGATPPASERKLRLFACACCRAGWPGEEKVEKFVEAHERFADGLLALAGFAAVEESLFPQRLWEVARDGTDWLGDELDYAQSGAGVQAALLREVFGNPWRPVAFDPSLRTQIVLSLAQTAYDERLAGGALDYARLAVLSDALEEAGCVGERCGHCGGSGADPDVTATSLPCPECGGEGWLLHPLLAHLRHQCVPGMGPCDAHPHVRGCWALDLVLGHDQGARTRGGPS